VGRKGGRGADGEAGRGRRGQDEEGRTGKPVYPRAMGLGDVPLAREQLPVLVTFLVGNAHRQVFSFFDKTTTASDIGCIIFIMSATDLDIKPNLFDILLLLPRCVQ
jgi:hypothetical protein